MVQAQIVTQRNQETKTCEDKVDEQPETEVLKCSQCGAVLKEDSTTCEFCGKKN